MVTKNIDIIPVVVGATGLLKTNLNNYLENIPGSPSAQQIQKLAVKGSVTILKRTLAYKAN